jgi:lipopolysaccharide/colanic/teichoic acid biosynthesis glycosyltransferase
MKVDMEADSDMRQAVVDASLGGSRLYPTLKRIVDVAVSLAILMVTAPLWMLIALAIKLDSPGPVIFRQRRVGLHGHEFDMYKFRSMVADADPGPHQEAFRRYAAGEALDHDGHAPLYKKSKDSRVTRIGRLLRATNLDELPQLINVLKSEMSIVGPRPAIRYEVDAYEGWHHDRFQVPQGITGLWQLQARNRVSLEDMVRLDLEYIDRRSILLDLWLILLTVPGMLRQPKKGRRARRKRV